MIFKTLNTILVNHAIKTNLVTAATEEETVAAATNRVAQMGLAEATAFGTKAILAQAAAWATTPLGIITLIAVGIWGAVKAYNALTVSVEEHKQMLDDAKSSYNDTASEIETLNTRLSDTQSKISELEGYDKLSFTDQQELDKLKAQNDELQREIDLQKQLKDAKQQDVNKEFASTMGADVGKTGEYQSTLQKEFAGNTGGVAIYRPKQLNEMEYATEQVKAYEGQIKAVKLYQKELFDATKAGDEEAEKEYQKQIELYQNKADETQKYLDQRIGELTTAAEGVTEDKSTKPYLDFINNLKDQWAIVYNEMSGDTDAFEQSQTDAFNRVANSTDFSDLISSAKTFGSGLDLTQDKYKDFIQALIDSGFITGKSAEDLQKVADAINDIGKSSSSASGLILEQSASDILGTLKDKYEALKQAQDDVNKTGYVSASTLDSLLTKYPDLSGYLEQTADGYTLTKGSLDDFITAQRNEYQVALSDAQTTAQNIVNAETLKKNGFDSTTMSIKEQLKAMEQLYGTQMLQKRQSLAESLRANNPNISSQDLAKDLYASDQGYLKLIDKARTAAANIDTAKDNLDTFSSVLNTVKRSADDSSSSSKSSAKETELYIADIDKLADAEQRLTDVQNKLSTEDILKDLATNSDERIANAQKEISLYQDEKKALENLNAERRKQIQENVSMLREQKFNVIYDPWKNNFEVTNIENINKLFGKTNDETNELRKSAESLIDTTKNLNDENIKGTQDWLSTVKSIKDEYSDMQSVVSNTVEKAFDKVSDLLNKEKEAYETQKSNLESVASTVTSYISDYISRLQDQNDELEKQISLQEKLEALDKAKTQRNKRVFVSGVGFTWQADQSDISSAQQDYDSALRQNDLDSRVKELQDYSDAWKNAVDSYENNANDALTSSVLGSDWRSDILGMNYKSINNFRNDYTDVLEQLDDGVYGSVAYQIKNLEDLQDEWNDSVDEANGVSTDYQSVLDLINTYESSNYSTRLTALSDFVSSAISQYQSLADAAKASANITATTTTVVSSSGGSSGGHSGDITIDDIVNGVGGLGFKDGYDPYGGSDDDDSPSSSAGSSSGHVSGGDGFGGYGDPSDYVTNWDEIKGYSTGGVVDYTGVAKVHGGQAAELMLNNTDVSKLYDYIHSGDVLAQSAANLLVSSNLPTGNNITPNSDQSISLNIGDIYLSGVNDSPGLADAIVRRLPSQILQKIHKR